GMDPTNTSQAGTTRTELTSHVDLVPLLMSLASGGNVWRNLPQYSYLADRADLWSMLSDPNAKGRPYILHTSDEDLPEEAPILGIPRKDALGSHQLPPAPLAQRSPPTHVIGYRTKDAKLGVYSYFAPLHHRHRDRRAAGRDVRLRELWHRGGHQQCAGRLPTRTRALRVPVSSPV